MNPRPSGYEPDELPGCSTPRLNPQISKRAVRCQAAAARVLSTLQGNLLRGRSIAGFATFAAERIQPHAFSPLRQRNGRRSALFNDCPDFQPIESVGIRHRTDVQFARGSDHASIHRRVGPLVCQIGARLESQDGICDRAPHDIDRQAKRTSLGRRWRADLELDNIAGRVNSRKIKARFGRGWSQ